MAHPGTGGGFTHREIPESVGVLNRALREKEQTTSLAILAEIRFHREGLARYFAAHSRFTVVGSVGDVRELIALSRSVPVDVVLVDIATWSGADGIRRVRTAVPSGGIVAIGVREEESEVIALAEAGTFGFVSRDASLEELRDAVESAARNESPCSGRVAAMLVRRVTTLADSGQPVRAPLTRRQLEIVQLIEEGLPNKAIAQRLFIEVPTVKNHVHHILERLGVHRREDAVRAVRMFST
jgi:DNA-binding NarL/FixJ family response regulator